MKKLIICAILILVSGVARGDEVDDAIKGAECGKPYIGSSINRRYLRAIFLMLQEQRKEKADEEKNSWSIPVVQGPRHAGYCAGCYYNADTFDWECSKILGNK